MKNKMTSYSLKMFRNMFLGLFGCLLSLNLIGQETPTIIPPSPNAASLGKYGDIPVSTYTGIPNISVPIWTLSGKELSLPISLSYHSSGIKVEENASWVGLGWALNAGGVITRTVKGRRDETGYTSSTGEIPSNPGYLNYFEHYLNGEVGYDPEPDLFFFNIGGYSGKFVFEEGSKEKIHVLPYQDIYIKVSKNTIYDFLEFTLITPDGTQYIFGENSHFEKTKTKTFHYRDAYPHQTPILDSNPTSNAITSWYLTSIISPSGKEKITFQYEDEQYEYTTSSRGKAGYKKTGEIEYITKVVVEYEIEGKRLSKISSSEIGVSIDFIATKDREDLKYDTVDKEPKALEEIHIKNTLGSSSGGDIERIFKLETDYFENYLLTSTNPNITDIPAEEEYLYKRLKLLSVQQFSGDGESEIPPHTFTYEESIDLPPKNAHTQDHWGYFNGKISENNYYSEHHLRQGYSGELEIDFETFKVRCNEFAETVTMSSSKYLNIAGDNRTPAYPAMEAGILKKISYPTGGHTEFTYEPHEYSFIGSKKLNDKVFFQNAPLAYLEKDWDPGENDDRIHQIGPENLIDKATILVNYEADFIIISESGYPNNMNVVSRNEVLLEKEGLNKPMIHIFALEGQIYLQYYLKKVVNGVEEIVFPVQELTPEIIEEEVDGAPKVGRVSGTIELTLDPGTYFYTVKKHINATVASDHNLKNNPNTSAHIEVTTPYDNGEVKEIIQTKMAGGLRIKQIENETPENELKIKEYHYTTIDKSTAEHKTISSGSLLATPLHITKRYEFKEEGTPSCTGCTFWNPFSLSEGCFQIIQYVYLVVESSADFQIPLSTTHGSHIGYSQVAVTQKGNGSTVFHYHSPIDIEEEFPKTFNTALYAGGTEISSNVNIGGLSEDFSEFIVPFVSVENNDWKRGLLTKTQYLDEGEKLIKEVKNHYLFEEKASGKIPGLSVIYSQKEKRFQSAEFWTEYTDYTINSGWAKLDYTETIDYSKDGEMFSVKKEFAYNGNNHPNVTSEKFIDSQNREIITEYIYPSDPGSGVPDLMWKNDDPNYKHIRNIPVKQTVKIDDTPISKLTSIYTYDATNDFVVLKEQINYPKADENEFVKTNFSYDDYKNIIEVHRDNGIYVTYIWGYNNSYPVFKIENARYADVMNELAAELTTINGTPTLDDLKLIHDDLRAALPEAMISAYSYKPLYGMNGQISPNGIKSSYEYDDFGRLRHVLDQDGNVLQKYEYHYKVH